MCKVEKPIEDFSAKRDGKSNPKIYVSRMCKECWKAKQREKARSFYLKNKASVKERNKAHYSKNKEKTISHYGAVVLAVE